MTGWTMLAHYFLPPPVILMALLVLPLPKLMRKGLLMFTNHFLSLILFGSVKLIHLMISVTFMVFLLSINATIRINHAYMKLPIDATPNHKTGVLATKWREERNFWIAFTAFFTWCSLARFFVVAVGKLELEEKIIRLERQIADLERAGQTSTTSNQSKPAPLEIDSEPKKSK